MAEYVDYLYPILVEIHRDQEAVMAQINFESRAIKFSRGTYLMLNLSEERRKQFNIDESLSMYLIDISENVIVNFYKMVACLIQLFRNCMNQYGFEVLTGIIPIDKLENLDNVGDKVEESN